MWVSRLGVSPRLTFSCKRREINQKILKRRNAFTPAAAHYYITKRWLGTTKLQSETMPLLFNCGSTQTELHVFAGNKNNADGYMLPQACEAMQCRTRISALLWKNVDLRRFSPSLSPVFMAKPVT